MNDATDGRLSVGVAERGGVVGHEDDSGNGH
jgi:hypothetical protein